MEKLNKHNINTDTVQKEDLEILQGNIEIALNNLVKDSISNGSLITDIELTASTTSYIAHRLDRKYKGWLVVNKNAIADIIEDVDSTKSKTLYVSLQSNADVTISLWVF